MKTNLEEIAELKKIIEKLTVRVHNAESATVFVAGHLINVLPPSAQKDLEQCMEAFFLRSSPLGAFEPARFIKLDETQSG